MVESPSPYRARLVLLGASNVTRAVSTVLECARQALGSPLEILAAIGHGRSYGMWSRVLGRGYPGIIECGLWKALAESRAQRPQLPTYALITDIGNDIMYGAPPRVIASWIEQCVVNLQSPVTSVDASDSSSSCITMTMLPIASIRRVTPWQFAVVKTILYPTRRLSYTQAMARGDDLHELVNDLGRRREVNLVELPRSWYGFDPVHIRLKHWKPAWSAIMGACAGADNARNIQPRGSIARWLRIKMALPEQWRLFGVDLGRQQPSSRLPDGTTVSMF